MVRRLLRRTVPNRVRQSLRHAIDGVLARNGYERRRAPVPCDFRGILHDPLDALRRAVGQPVVVDVPGQLCRGWPMAAFPLGRDAAHPLVVTAKQVLAGATVDYGNSALCAYYDAVQPANAAELLGLEPSSVTPALREAAPLEADFPWRSAPGHAVKARRLRQARLEAEQFGLDVPHEGMATVGPVSAVRGRFEHWRIRSVVESIADKGYLAGSECNHIEAVVMRRDNAWRVLIKGGQHRAAALVSLGHARIPLIVRPHRVVDRATVARWPGVRAGAFTVEQALAVFDRVFAGRQPPLIERAWLPLATRSYRKNA